MSTGITPQALGKSGPSAALKSAEWMAENAYIAPGFHRLLTAGGLTLGLWGGRHFMDVITARNAATGEDIPAAQTNEFLRPLHGIMRYNPYSDNPADRWKFVIDKVTPVAAGVVAAYFGGKYFFNGHMPNKEAFFPAGKISREAVAAGKYSTEVTDALMRVSNADAIRKWASATFIESSSTGQHIFGALWPFNNGMIAVSFQEGAQRNISFPGLKALNKALGNTGGTSRGQFSAMRNTAVWMQANILRDVPIESWASSEELLTRARDGLQKFPEQAAKFEGKLVEAYRAFIRDAKAHVSGLTGSEKEQKLADFLTGKVDPKRGLFMASHDHMLKSLEVDGVKFDLRKTSLAQGPFQELGRRFGSRKHQAELLEKHAEYLRDTHGYELDPKAWSAEQLHTPPWKVAAIYGGASAAVVGGLGTGAIVGSKLHSRSQREHKPHILDQSSIEHHIKSPNEKPKDGHNIIDWINDKPLSIAHWGSRVLVAPPSMHRFMNAAYLSAVLYVGMKGADVLTGRVLTKLNSTAFVKDAEGKLISASILPKENVWKPLQGLHGIMSYTPGSAATADRWKQAAHYIMPVGLGMFGTATGSHMYFADRIRALKTPETLEDYADRISMEQSKPYAALTAVTSIFNTGSGIHLLPVFNYSANLHNRYVMGSGQQVAMPGIGKWWSGNAGTTPWGVKRTLKQLSNYLTYNDAARPKELRSLVHSLIGKLYPTLSDEELLDHKQVMIDRIRDVRDSYLVEGVVPPSKRAALGEAMQTLFSGAGFEALLRESGLDPAKANLASNGASGSIANFLGSKKTVEKLGKEYKEKFAERLVAQGNADPADFLKGLLDKGIEQPKKFAERARGGDSSSVPVMSV